MRPTRVMNGSADHSHHLACLAVGTAHLLDVSDALGDVQHRLGKPVELLGLAVVERDESADTLRDEDLGRSTLAAAVRLGEQERVVMVDLHEEARVRTAHHLRVGVVEDDPGDVSEVGGRVRGLRDDVDAEEHCDDHQHADDATDGGGADASGAHGSPCGSDGAITMTGTTAGRSTEHGTGMKPT